MIVVAWLLATPVAASVVTGPACTAVCMPSFRSLRGWAAPSSSTMRAVESSKRTPLTMIEPKPAMRPAENDTAAPVPPVSTPAMPPPPPPQPAANEAASSALVSERHAPWKVNDAEVFMAALFVV